MARRLLITLLSCGLLTAFASGCAKGDDRAAARETVSTYLKAFSDGDGDTACRLLTETARDYVTGMAGTVGAKDCQGAFKKVRNVIGRPGKELARDTKIKTVDVQGQTAKVTMTSTAGDAIADLQKVGEQWLISSLPKS